MENLICYIIFIVGLLIMLAIRLPYIQENKLREVIFTTHTFIGDFFLFLLYQGMITLPVIFVMSNWLSFADYQLPQWTIYLGLALFLFSIILYWKSHADLKNNWSVNLEVKKGHQLITDGVYKHIRHPMYLSFWIWAIAQALVLHNWVAGLSNLVFFALLYFYRIAKEEKMMTDIFGSSYLSYMAKTSRLIPNVNKGFIPNPILKHMENKV